MTLRARYLNIQHMSLNQYCMRSTVRYPARTRASMTRQLENLLNTTNHLESQVESIVDAMENSLDTLGGILYPEGPNEDVPIPFKGTDLADHLEILAEQGRVSPFLDFLVTRIRKLLSDTSIKSI